MLNTAQVHFIKKQGLQASIEESVLQRMTSLGDDSKLTFLVFTFVNGRGGWGSSILVSAVCPFFISKVSVSVVVAEARSVLVALSTNYKTMLN